MCVCAQSNVAERQSTSSPNDAQLEHVYPESRLIILCGMERCADNVSLREERSILVAQAPVEPNGLVRRAEDEDTAC